MDTVAPPPGPAAFLAEDQRDSVALLSAGAEDRDEEAGAVRGAVQLLRSLAALGVYDRVLVPRLEGQEMWGGRSVYDRVLVPRLEAFLVLRAQRGYLDLRQHAALLSSMRRLGHVAGARARAALVASTARAMAAAARGVAAARPSIAADDDSPSVDAGHPSSSGGGSPGAGGGGSAAGSDGGGGGGSSGAATAAASAGLLVCTDALSVACGLEYQCAAGGDPGALTAGPVARAWRRALSVAAPARALRRARLPELARGAAALARARAAPRGAESAEWVDALGEAVAAALAWPVTQQAAVAERGGHAEGTQHARGTQARMRVAPGAPPPPRPPTGWQQQQQAQQQAQQEAQAQQAQQARLAQLAELAAAAAELGCRPGAAALAPATAPGGPAAAATLSALPPDVLADLAWGLVVMGGQPGPHWTRALLDASHAALPSMGARCAVRTAAALARARALPHAAWLRDFDARVARGAPAPGELRVCDVVEALGALTAMRHEPDWSAGSRLVGELERGMGGMTAEEMRSALASLRALWPKMRDRKMRALSAEMARRLAVRAIAAV
ncbi:hypothetical protein FOA52_016282 [Chlamydomonas sp. UWO 241]|nr:hypothetical protein FOA52_016282 [Chlamydomonas sp. UWO 241]